MPFYAVAKGVVPGIYEQWSECQKQTMGFKGPQFKKFNTKEEAQEFIDKHTKGVVDKRPAKPSKEKASSSEAKSAEKNDSSNGAADSSDDAEKEKPRKRSLSPDSSDDAETKKPKLSDDGFEIDEKGRVVLFTDGCCHGNGKNGARAGIGVFFGRDSPLNVSEPVVGRATNNTAEIQAIIKALRVVKSKGHDDVLVKTDSQFTINCLTKWIDGWKKKGWKKADGTEVINKEDLMVLDKESDGIRVEYMHVDAHKGIYGNEKADELAKQGSKSYKAPATD